MAKDTYDNVPTSEDPIFQKLAGQGVAPEVLQREDKRFQELVALFSDLVREDVERELVAQPLEDISKAFVDSANALLGQDPTRTDTPELREAAEIVRNEITAELKDGIKVPDAEEIRDHVYVLSQSVLGNWLAMLQKANRLREPSAKVLRLNANALPQSMFAASLLFQGLELFVLDNQLVEQRFNAFLEKIRQSNMFQSVAAYLRGDRFKAIELAPDLALVSGDGNVWYLTASLSDAQALTRQLEPRRETETDLGKFSPQWAMAGVAACKQVEMVQWDDAMVLEVIDLAVEDAIRNYQQGVLQSGTASIPDEEVVHIALDLLNPSTASSSDANRELQLRVDRICQLVEDKVPQAPVLQACQAVFGAASKAVGVAVQMRASNQVVPKTVRPRVGYRNQPLSPQAKVIFNVAGEAARQVLYAPRVKSYIANIVDLTLP